MSSSFDCSASCPSCGAPMTFRFAGAAAQVCKHCRFVVARTDRNLVAVGRMADLVDIPSPLSVGATGTWGGERFEVEGRVQMDRAGAPGAPWQEIFIGFPSSGRWAWVASAQGRWYSTSEVTLPPGGVPPLGALRPGFSVALGSYGTFTVAEVGRRRVVSGEGELPRVPPPGEVTGFADIAAPGGAFGTIDYGDGRAAPTLYLGRQFDPAQLAMDGGGDVAQPEAAVAALACPNCGGNLPLVSPSTTERVICRYCGMTSDFTQGALVALRPAPKPPMDPYVPLGAEGQLRGMKVICIAFVIRGCTVDGERYRWREYLLYAGPSVGYVWLMEEDGAWSLVTTIPPGEVQVQGTAAIFQGRAYGMKQSVSATVEYVVGELYWKVEIGETVRATDYEGPGGKVSVEHAPTEVTTSFVAPLPGPELAAAFNLAPPPRAAAGAPGGCATTVGSVAVIGFILLVLLLIAAGDCGSGASGVVSPGFGSPSFGGK